jgi:hypothetical protein
MKRRFLQYAKTFLPFLSAAVAMRCDSIAFARSFEHIEKELQETEFEKLKSEEIIDYDFSAPDGAASITHRQVTQLGQPDWVNHYAGDLPAFDVEAVEFPVATAIFGGHYFWTVEELDQVAMDPTIRLDAERKKSAQDGMRRWHDKVAAVGSTKHGRLGFVNSDVVPLTTPITGDFANSTDDEVIADIQALLRSVETNSGENAVATHLGVDRGTWARINQPYGDNKNYTIRKWLLENEDALKVIYQWNHLDTADVAGTGPRIVAHRKAKDVVKYNAVIVYKELSPQDKDLKVKVPVYAKTGFTEWRKPLHGAYMDVG